MKEFFNGVHELFQTVLFVPYNILRETELENWWASNAVTWIFLAILIISFIYWMLELKKFNDNDEEDKSISSHSFL